jgi:hypothetical protein
MEADAAERPREGGGLADPAGGEAVADRGLVVAMGVALHFPVANEVEDHGKIFSVISIRFELHF